MTESTTADAPPVRQLLDQFVAEMLAVSPTSASQLGRGDHDHILETRSMEAVEDARERAERWLATFERCDSSALSGADAFDVELALSHLRGRRALHSREGYRSNPVPYLNLAMSGVAVLLERDEVGVHEIEAATSRMDAVAGVLEAARVLVEPAQVSEVHAQRAQRLCATAVDYFYGLPDLVGDLATPAFVDAARRTADTYRQATPWVDDVGARAMGDWRLGAEIYSDVLCSRHGCAMSAREAAEAGAEALSVESERVDAAEAAHGKQARQAFDRSQPFASVDEHLGYLQARVDAARTVVARRSLATLPDGEWCRVRQTPLRHALRQSYSYTADGKVGGWLDIPARSAGQGRPGFSSSTVAHETYPGHHLHSVRGRSNTSVLSRMIQTPFYLEGWGLYAETVMHDAGFLDDPGELISYHRNVRHRAARVVLDAGLHAGTITIEDAHEVLTEQLRVSASAARVEIERYMASPTQAAGYYLGYLELASIRDTFIREHGTLTEFHDRATTIGAPPLHLARTAILGGDTPVHTH